MTVGAKPEPPPPPGGFAAGTPCDTCGAKPGEAHVFGERRESPVNAVEHPPHYKSGGIEAIDVIEAFGLGFCLGNTVKYILRAGRKDEAKTLEDLAKARWYLDREIERRNSGK